MRVTQLNSFFRTLGTLQLKYRSVVLAVFALITVVCCAGLSKFKIVNGSDGWYGDADKLKINKDKYEKIFGNSHSVGILFESEDVFSEESLKVIESIGNRMLSEIPFADKLSSLIEVDVPIGNEEGFEVVKPFGNGIPSDPESLKKGRDIIMRGTEKTNALINTMVSEDGRETWISLTLLPYTGDVDEASYSVGYALYDIINSDEFKSENYTLYGTGQPYYDALEEIYEVPDLLLRVGLGFVVMVLFLIIFVRTPLGVIIPTFATTGAIASVLGGMSYFNVKADTSLLTLPILLGMALSIGYSIHYINIFKIEFRRTGKRKDSCVKVVEECGWPVFFTVLTTIASLISFALVDMKPVSWVGKTSSLVVLAVYVYIAVLIPIFMSFGKDRSPDTRTQNGCTKIDMAFAKWADVAWKKRWLVIAVSAVVFAICIPNIFKITVNTDYIQTVGIKVPYIRQLKSLLEKTLGNQYSYSIMISYDEEDSFKQPEKMKSLEEFQKFLGTLSLTKISGETPRVNSIIDIIKEMYRALNEGKDEYYIIPEDEYVLAQIMELSSIELNKDFSICMDDEFKVVAIEVDMKLFSENEALENVSEINQKFAELFPDAECTILGDMIEYAEMSRRMVRGELKSFGFSFIIIAVMLIIAFSSIRTGLIAMIPNIAPVIIIAAVMGRCNFPLDFVTVTVMPMILGIAVDDTIHLTTHLKYGLEKHGSYITAMEDACREIGTSMFMSTFILCSIFAVYVFSPIKYLFVIGILSITGLATALIADYTITPVLLYIIKPFGKEKKSDE